MADSRPAPRVVRPVSRSGSRATAPVLPPTDRSSGTLAWSMLSSTIAGAAVWGGAGLLLDHLLGLRVFLPLGVLLGFAAATYLAFARTRVVATPPPTPPAPDPVSGRLGRVARPTTRKDNA